MKFSKEAKFIKLFQKTKPNSKNQTKPCQKSRKFKIQIKNKAPKGKALILLISLDSSLITIIGLEILAPAAPPISPPGTFSPVLDIENG